MRWIYLLSWILFLTVVLIFDWRDVRLHYVSVGLLAFPGILVALGWLVRDGKWAYASAAMSLLTVIGYCIWWGIEIVERYEADPMPGLLRTVSVQFRIPGALLSQRLSQGDYLVALYESYWQIAMPLLQIAFATLIAARLFSIRQTAAKF